LAVPSNICATIAVTALITKRAQIFGKTIGQGWTIFWPGQILRLRGRHQPAGKFPCVNGVQTPACTVNLPVGPPTFERSNRYTKARLYFQDSWKISRRLTVNLGVRWEYFGVQHNVNANLDSNFYTANNSNQFLAIADGSVQTTPNSPIGELWKPSKHNFAPASASRGMFSATAKRLSAAVTASVMNAISAT
jgi:outer membrane receptor protein involved in Fe transport